jgi:hypothetical protein
MLGIVYIRTTNENHDHDCGSFILSSEAQFLYIKLFGIEYDKINLSRNSNYPNFPISRADQRFVRIVEILGDRTCIDCTLGIKYEIPYMLNFIRIECNLKTDKTEKIVLLEDKYMLFLIRQVLYQNISYDNIIQNLLNILENKSGIIKYNNHSISINTMKYILLSDEKNYEKVFKIKKILSYI